MTITPVEIRHVRLRRGFLGYRRRATDELLDEIVQSYEATWRDRADLEDQVERLETELAHFRELERLLRDTMMSAERAAESMRADASRDYDLTLQEARLKAREIVDQAEGERERLRAEIRRLQAARGDVRTQLRTALQRLGVDLEAASDLEDTGELTLPEQAA